MRTSLRLAALGIAFSILLVAVARPSRAQNRPQQNQQAHAPRPLTAAEVGARVQTFYDRTPVLRASFYQTYFSKLYNNYQRSNGTVVFKRPGRMRFDYAQPSRKVYASDGTRLIAYEPGEGNDPGQYLEQALTDAQLPAALGFLTGTRRLADEFDMRLLDATQQGFTGGYVLELRPKTATPHFDRLLFFVNDQAGPSGGPAVPIIRRLLIIDHAGNRNRFDFSRFEFNPNVEDAVFAFRPPNGARRITP